MQRAWERSRFFEAFATLSPKLAAEVSIAVHEEVGRWYECTIEGISQIAGNLTHEPIASGQKTSAEVQVSAVRRVIAKTNR